MKRSVIAFSLALVLAIAGTTSLLGADRPANDDSVAVRFSKFVESLPSITADQRDSLLKEISKSGDNAVSDSLMKIYPEYSQALAGSDLADVTKSAQLLQPMIGANENPWLSADATYYLARTLMNSERFEEAIPMLEQLLGPMSEWSAHQAEVHYFMAACHAGTLQFDHSLQAFATFLEKFPDAPERLRVSAWRQLEELQQATGNKMNDVTSRMEYSRRRLDITEIGEATQGEQDRIVKLLAEMIQEQQKKECSSGSCDKSGVKKQQQQSAKNEQKAPQKPSKSQTGGMSNVANGQYVEKSFDNGDASPWSRLRERSRDPANAAMKEKLPSRYREIVERYNDAINGVENKTGDK